METRPGARDNIGNDRYVAALPFESTVAPQWRVRVLDEAGNSVRGVRLRESWSDYSLESHDHIEDPSTDADGFVTFPR
jgi:hypothetical protein